MSDISVQSEEIDEQSDEFVDQAFEQNRGVILGEGIFLNTYPRISILSEDDHAVILRCVFQEINNDDVIFTKDCNLFIVILMASSLLSGGLLGLKGVNGARGKILSIPGNKEANIENLQKAKENIDKMIELLDGLSE